MVRASPMIWPGLVLAPMSLLLSGSILGQEPAPPFPLRGGGEGVRLGADLGHTIVAHPADGGFNLQCLQGDEHDASAALFRILAETTGAGVDLTAESRDVGGESVAVTLRFDSRRRAGADDGNRLLLYTPGVLQRGSSGSHFDTRAFPNLLMEPNISADLALTGLDLTDEVLLDLGWRRPRETLATEIRFTDADGTGFNDLVAGAERRGAMEAAAAVWASHLGSAAPLVIEAVFAPLTCTAGVGAVLAAAGPAFAFRDFPGGVPDTWYPGPVAESRARSDLSGPDDPDLYVFFNSAIDEACLGAGTGWYYGTQGEVPDGKIPFLPTALHELGHGLGFTGFVDLQTGAYFRGRPDIWARMTFDNVQGTTWDDMGKAGRRRSALREGEVAITSDRARVGARDLLDGTPLLRIDAPAGLAGTHSAGVAAFGASLEDGALRGELALANDGTDAPRLACEPLVNAADVAGKIVIVARGECFFTLKVRNAQDAGAIGVIVTNNVPGPPSNMSGTDDSITIPAVMIERSLGGELRRVVR